MPLSIVLFEPEIPPNTGNIIRLASNTGSDLHLIRPLGFELDDKRLRRAGLDYHDLSQLYVHESWTDFLTIHSGKRLIGCSTRGSRRYDEIPYREDDFLVFGPETRGLPANLIESKRFHAIARLPMSHGSRSLNLSNAVSIFVYEAWRQLGFPQSL